ncbi:MAG: 50S ribosomal protein L18 [Candidatus Kapaibacteriota bacterium]|mgnify:CR=1 FL=1|jgi:large subunit ribosomal protein L18
MNRIALKQKRYDRRNRRVRKNIEGSPERPRLTVFRSAEHIYAQIIDDTTARTIAAASTTDREVKAKLAAGMTKTDKCKVVGLVLAERAKSAKVSAVAFDRNGFLYHGRIKALAEAAREGGLDF